jgi:hypothetical protein
MKASRFTAEQIVGILHEASAGGVVRELCRQHGEEIVRDMNSGP